ncbi:uncharacterized protein LOC110464443 [Mizuhopecten yessoensis]|uniref:uncharacterized protein LOC110464443 n=1 Tax=Mizuhopecten yessoensis TaxID=6573 RepID=UPI000B45903F|nr:uncharacterized protein LOC110464443 [Mizuhopecten yessoensis]
MVTLGCLGVGGLTAIVGTLMCCLHMLGCYSGPMLSVGARHVYPKSHLCTCQDYCCCCCRCCKFCKMCCVGDEGDEDEEADDEQKVAMLKNENDNQYPENTKEPLVEDDESKRVPSGKIERKRQVPKDALGRKKREKNITNP